MYLRAFKGSGLGALQGLRLRGLGSYLDPDNITIEGTIL